MNNGMEDSHLPGKESIDEYILNYEIFVSPDKKQVLYDNNYFTLLTNEFIKRELMILHSDGTSHPVNGWESLAPFTIRGWRGNDWIELDSIDGEGGTIVLLNPDTGLNQRISIKLPELYFEPSLPLWYGRNYPLPVLDPLITRAIYLRKSTEMQIALFDIKNEKILWTRSITDSQNEPQWSADGAQFAIAVSPLGKKSYELFSITREGIEIQLTDIGKKYQNVGIANIQWSPDNKFIAFGLDYDEDNYFTPKIAVLDITKGKIIDYCLSNLSATPIWSPDSRYLAVSIRDNTTSRSKLVIIDNETDYAFSIDPSIDAIGWME
jgi:hypothetical protein